MFDEFLYFFVQKHKILNSVIFYKIYWFFLNILYKKIFIEFLFIYTEFSLNAADSMKYASSIVAILFLDNIFTKFILLL